MEVIAVDEDKPRLHEGVAGKRQLIAVIELTNPVKEMTEQELAQLAAAVANEVRRDLRMHGAPGGES